MGLVRGLTPPQPGRRKMKDLSRLLQPSSVAVLGSGWARNVIEQLDQMGFDGPVWPVHPTRAEIGGKPCFATLADLPAAPDAVFVGVNRHATIDVIAELSAMGAGGAICFASGWSEAGDAELQDKLVQAAGSMPILGPNCYGVINYLDGALLWPDQHGGRKLDGPGARGVALISQSSNIVINLTMQARGLPVAYVACLGNAAQIGLSDLAAALLADDRVTALGLYIEGIADAAAFATLAIAARKAGKPIVAMKAGKTEAAQVAAASHTASLAGGGAASSAFLRQAGIAEVTTPEGLIEALKIAHVHGIGLGDKLCSLSCSGGEAGLAADLGHPAGIRFTPPSADQVTRLNGVLGPLVAIANPLDYQTFIWGDLDKTTEVFATMLGGYDAGIFIIDPPRPDRCDPSSFEPALDAIEAAQRLTGKPAFPVSLLPEGFNEARASAMIDRGVVPLMGLRTAFEALRAAQTPKGQDGWQPWPTCPVKTAELVDEFHAKALISKAGILVPTGRMAPNLTDLSTDGLTAPYVLKGLGFAHKTEAGAVRLGVQDPALEPPMVGARGYLLEEMVTDGVAELIVGIRRDPVYGATLTLGLGGTEAELLADTVTLIAPVTAQQIKDALRQLRLWPLLDGWRGRKKADVVAATQVALTLQTMLQTDPKLTEIEINPLIVRTSGAVAVDAVIWRER